MEAQASPGTLLPTWAKLSEPIELVVKAVAIGVPVLYATGRIYSEAYWSELRIPASLLGYSAEDYLYLGFVAIAVGLANLVGVDLYSKIGYIVAIALAIGGVVVGSALLARFIRRKIAARVRIARRYVKQATAAMPGEAIQHLHAFGAVTSAIIALLLGGLGVVIFVLLPIALVHRAGKHDGLRERVFQEEMVSEQAASTRKARTRAHYRADGGARNARLVECGTSWCVIHEGNGFVAIPFVDVVRIDQESEPPRARASTEKAPAPPSAEVTDPSQPQSTEPRAR